MIHLATTCAAGHLKIVPALGQRNGVPYFGASAASCRHMIGGEFCGAKIEETQVLCEEHGVWGSEGCPCVADLEPAPDCGIAEPHAPGMHAPAVDLEEDEEEEPDYDPDIICETCGDLRRNCTGDEKEYAAEGREVCEGSVASFYSTSRLCTLLAAQPSTVAMGLLLALGAVASLGLTIYFAATGHWVLALLV
jgi:hypothetical protein